RNSRVDKRRRRCRVRAEPPSLAPARAWSPAVSWPGCAAPSVRPVWQWAPWEGRRLRRATAPRQTRSRRPRAPASPARPRQLAYVSCDGLRNRKASRCVRNRCRVPALVGKDAIADRDEIGAGPHQRLYLVERSGKSDAGDFEQLSPPRDALDNGVERRPSSGRIWLTEHDVVGPAFSAAPPLVPR